MRKQWYLEDGDDSGAYDGLAPRCPPAVRWLIIAAVVVFIVEEVVVNLTSYGPAFLGALGLSRDALFGRGFVWQLATYAFLHDPADILHIIFNMLFLYWFGREVERVWGTRRFLAFYFSAAAFAGLLFAGSDYLLRQHSLCMGASGAVMAALMVFAIWYPNQTILFMFLFPMRMRTFVLIVIGIEVFGLLNLSRAHGIANMAHLGGLLYGFLVVRSTPTWRSAARWLSARRLHDPAADQRRLDMLLDKVHQKGLHSLSWGERRFLKRISARR